MKRRIGCAMLLLLSLATYAQTKEKAGGAGREAVESKEAPKAAGPYSQAIKAGGFVFCAGQTARDPVTSKLIEGDVSAQTDRVLRNLTAAGNGFVMAEFPTAKGAGRNAEYTISVTQWVRAVRWAGSKQFDAEYFKRHNYHPTSHPMLAYAALQVAAHAINDAKALDKVKIRDAIRKINLSMTPFGPIKFDANGQNQHPVVITQVQGGEFRIVYPPDIADSKPVIPAPEWSKR